jgi:hypothetical protein
MAEFYAVLKKAVAGLHPNAHDARRSVYDKARAALVGQLKAINPPLSTSEISRQRLELEEAIRRVERESSQGYTGPSEPSRGNMRAPAPVQDYQDYEDEEPHISEEAFAEDVFNQALEEIERQGQPEAQPPVPARSRGRPAPQYDRPERYDYEPAPAAYRGPPQRYDPRDQYDEEPSLSPGYEVAAPAIDHGDYQNDRQMQRWAEPGRSPGRGRGDDAHELIGRPSRRSRLPSILLFVLILAICGGIGAFAWSQRDMISEVVASLDLPFLTDGPGVVGGDDSGAEESAKNDDRLLDGQEPSTSNGARPGATAGGGEELASAAVDQPSSNGGSGDSLVAQKGVLYEEPLGGGVPDQFEADAVWRYIESEANGPVVQASIEVPERSLKVRMMIRKNIDVNLPASHLIEVFVDVPSNFAGEGVESVPSLVLKQSEGEQGKPVVGAAAKVAEGFFWIALSDDSAAVDNNLALLRERMWFDMPLVYSNGQRAILTFEKGFPGEQAFAKAMTAWGG